MRKKFLIGALLVGMTAVSACVEATSVSNRPSQNPEFYEEYIAYMACVDAAASANLIDGKTSSVDSAIRSAHANECSGPFNTYVDLLGGRALRIQKMEAFDPIVRQTVAENTIKQAIEVFKPVYREALQ